MINKELKLGKYEWSYIDILYSLSIISIFLISKIYPVIFSTFIGVGLYSIIKKGRLDLRRYKWIVLSIIFIILSLIVSLIHNQLSISNYIKLFINISFLIVSYLVYKDSLDENLINKILSLIKIIILINFVQIIWIYLSNGLFKVVFLDGGLENSDTRYIVSQYKTFIGAESKNIWSSKLAFIQLIYLYYVSLKGNTDKKDWGLIIVSSINILLLLSRTGQVCYFIGLGYFVIYKLLNNKNEKIRNISKTLGLLGVVLLGFIFIDKFLNIKFDNTDGGFIRLIYWRTFFVHIWDTSFIFGNGMLYTSNFLQEYSPYYIGENNMHNVILNTWLDFGLVGLFTYIGFMWQYIYIAINKKINLDNLFILILPLIATLMLQYLGYDNDIVIYLSLIYIVNKSSQNVIELNNMV